MVKKCFCILMACYLAILTNTALAQKSKQNYDIMRTIRHQKFDLILPQAMRDNQVDMWIHVVQSGKRDPLALDLGGWSEYRPWEPVSYYIFTDRGEGRIERILLAGEDFDGLYDIQGSSQDLLDIVKQRDPKVIAVNMSNNLTIADGLSHTEYLRLTKTLGEKYSARLVSADKVITDFRTRRVQLEIIAFARSLELQRQIMEQALRRIEPGITTPDDVGWWTADQLLAEGIGATYQAASLFIPFSPGAQSAAGRSDSEGQAYQPGDFLTWDLGVGYLNFGTDIKRSAYILKEDEKTLPAGLRRAWERGQQARKVLRDSYKPGKTAGETLKTVVKAMEDVGFVYTPSDDRTDKAGRMMRELGDDSRSAFTLDFHATGNTSVSDASAGPAMAPFRAKTANLTVKPNFIFALEFVINTWVPEWQRRVSISFEDNAIVTHSGVEYLSPVEEQLTLIR